MGPGSAQSVKPPSLTIEGSATLCGELFYLGMNYILQQRAVYDDTEFESRKRYGTTVFESVNSELKEYLQSIQKTIQPLLEKGQVKQVVLAIKDAESEEVLERWNFDITTDRRAIRGEVTSDKSLDAIEKEMRALFRAIGGSLSYLPVLDGFSTYFDVQIQTSHDADTDGAWAEADAILLPNASAVRLRCVSTGIHQTDASVAYRTGAGLNNEEEKMEHS